MCIRDSNYVLPREQLYRVGQKTALQTHGRYSVNSNQSNINELIYKNTKTPKDRQIRTLAAKPLEICT